MRQFGCLAVNGFQGVKSCKKFFNRLRDARDTVFIPDDERRPYSNEDCAAVAMTKVQIYFSFSKCQLQ